MPANEELKGDNTRRRPISQMAILSWLLCVSPAPRDCSCDCGTWTVSSRNASGARRSVDRDRVHLLSCTIAELEAKRHLMVKLVRSIQVGLRNFEQSFKLSAPLFCDVCRSSSPPAAFPHCFRTISLLVSAQERPNSARILNSLEVTGHAAGELGEQIKSQVHLPQCHPRLPYACSFREPLTFFFRPATFQFLELNSDDFKDPALPELVDKYKVFTLSLLGCTRFFRHLCTSSFVVVVVVCARQ